MSHKIPFFAKRFVAGITLDEAIQAVEPLHEGGLFTSLDILGENVTSREEATGHLAAYKNIVSVIHEKKLPSNISIKLTMLGLDIDQNFCHENLFHLLEFSQLHGEVFVRLDMEGTPYTQKTMDLFLAARKKFDNVGIVLQAYLHRTYNDIQEVMKHGGRIRLCKGAYKETPTLAFQNMKEIRENYLKLAELLLNDPQYHAFATHDDYLIHATRQMAEQKKRAKDTFEYQMLYGLRKKSWFEAHDFGYHFRVYVPFGTTWFPYFSRRLRERKENVLFILRNLLRD